MKYSDGYNQAKKDALAVCDAFIDEFHSKYVKGRPTERHPWVRELYTGAENAIANIKDAIQLMSPEEPDETVAPAQP